MRNAQQATKQESPNRNNAVRDMPFWAWCASRGIRSACERDPDYPEIDAFAGSVTRLRVDGEVGVRLPLAFDRFEMLRGSLSYVRAQPQSVEAHRRIDAVLAEVDAMLDPAQQRVFEHPIVCADRASPVPSLEGTWPSLYEKDEPRQVLHALARAAIGAERWRAMEQVRDSESTATMDHRVWLSERTEAEIECSVALTLSLVSPRAIQPALRVFDPATTTVLDPDGADFVTLRFVTHFVIARRDLETLQAGVRKSRLDDMQKRLRASMSGYGSRW